MTFRFPPSAAPRSSRMHLAPVRPNSGGRARVLLRWAILPLGIVAWRRTGRLRAALDRSGRKLHQARQQFDTLFHQAPVGICQTDLSGRYMLANDRYRALLGRREATLQGLNIHDLTHPDHRSEQRAGYARMAATGEPYMIEKRYVRPDGTEVWVVSHLSVTRDEGGRPRNVIAAVQDISHRRAMDSALHAMNATLEQRVATAVAERARVEETLRQSQRMEALGQLAGGVAHDFNNVLQAIAGGARLIQRRPEDPDAVRRLAGLVVDAADRGASITRRLLSFARRGALQPGPVDVATLLDEMQQMLSRTLGSGIKVEARSDPGLPSALADKDGLETALVNLATNARDAMLDEDGLPRPGVNHVTLHATTDDGAAAALTPGRYVLILVSDTGNGMDGAVLSHATEPFFSTKPRGRGTGLGLPVARGFAEESGGRLLLDSRPREGTVVRLWLPAAADSTASYGPRQRRRAAVMVVDDDAEVREVIQDTLSSRGCMVSSHSDAATALRGLASERPDILVSDLSMPGADGLTLIREARALCPGLPAILLTGHANPALHAALNSIAGGPSLLLQKPVSGAALGRHVAALLPEDVVLDP